jgi:hypothetical protein
MKQGRVQMTNGDERKWQMEGRMRATESHCTWHGLWVLETKDNVSALETSFCCISLADECTYSSVFSWVVHAGFTSNATTAKMHTPGIRLPPCGQGTLDEATTIESLQHKYGTPTVWCRRLRTKMPTAFKFLKKKQFFIF